MIDANTDAMNREQERLEKIDTAFDQMIENHELSLKTISDEVCYLMDIAKDYDGYDFTEALQEYLEETICL